LRITQGLLAIELDPNDAGTYRDHGLAFEKLGNCEGAIHDYSKAIKLDANNPWNYYARGCAYCSVGKN
jgi:Flp pilus assembly protein TadD